MYCLSTVVGFYNARRQAHLYSYYSYAGVPFLLPLIAAYEVVNRGFEQVSKLHSGIK